MSDSTTRLRLDIAYDGSEFSGWASQRDQRTVQGELQRVLTHLAGQSDRTHLRWTHRCGCARAGSGGSP